MLQHLSLLEADHHGQNPVETRRVRTKLNSVSHLYNLQDLWQQIGRKFPHCQKVFQGNGSIMSSMPNA